MWLVPQLEVNWSNLLLDFSCPSCTWCWSGIVEGTWTTYDGDYSTTFPTFAWIARIFGWCGWSFPFLEYNASNANMPTQWSTSPWHRWGTHKVRHRVCRCDRLLDVYVEWWLYRQHNLRHPSQSQKVVACLAEWGLVWSKSNISDSQMLFLCPNPNNLGFGPTLG